MCKCKFNQGESTMRFCEECRSTKNRFMRQKYNLKRKQVRKGYKL